MDVIFNLFKVRYTKLDELMEKHCKEISPDSRVNLFINLEPVFRKLLSANIDEYLRVKTDEKSFELISNIINLAAHYRLYFTKNKLYSNVYMYMGYPFKTMYKNALINSEFRKAYVHKFTKDTKSIILTNTLDNVIPFIKIILEYIQGVYFIESYPMEPSLIPSVINKIKPTNNVNFIISTDRYDYQYVNHGYRIIRPKKEESYIVTKDNLMNIVKTEEKMSNDIEVGSNFYPFILSLMGDKNRGIGKIKSLGLSGILKMINKAIKANIIGKDVSNLSILSTIVKEEYKPLLLSNFACTDIEVQMNMVNVKDTYEIEKQLADKFDNVSLKKINDEFFKGYPIMLMELTDANKLLKKKDGPKNDIWRNL